MDETAESLRLFNSAARRKIGRACAREPCTLAELARRLRRPTQGLNSVVDGMLDDNLLLKQGDGRGAKYLLRPERLPLLEVAVAETAKPGRLHAHQRVLIVGGGDLDALARTLAEKRFLDHVGWATRVDGGARWIVALDEAPDGLVSDELEAELTRLGAGCSQLRVDVLMDPSALRKYLRALTH